MRQVPLSFPFGLALFFTLFTTVFFPKIPLFTFSPFFALLYYRRSLATALWIATLSGLMIDLLTSEFRLGIHAWDACITTLLLYKQKKHFFEDKPLALSLFTILISATSTLMQWLLIATFDRSLPLSGKGIVTDLFLMPIVDGAYAFFAFTCPMQLFVYIKKRGWRLFFSELLAHLHLKKRELRE